MKTEVDHILMIVEHSVIFWGAFEIPTPLIYLQILLPGCEIHCGFCLN